MPVWIQTYQRKTKTAYRLRWPDPTTGKWRSRTVGTDKKKADREAADLERQLSDGSYNEAKPTTWQAFVDEHCRLIPGDKNRTEAVRVLADFGKAMEYPPPRRITFGTLEKYSEILKARGLSVASQNKHFRYLRAAFRKAIRRDYLFRNPLDGWQWQREEEPAIRELSIEEEARLITAAKDLYGVRLTAFIRVALATGGRRSEICGLAWNRIDLDDLSVTFTATKGKRDRRGFLDAASVADLRTLQAQTMLAGGPFVGLNANLGHKWSRIITKAGIADLTIHDLRRTAISRLCRSGAKMPAIQRLAGHASITTTAKHYIRVADEDLRKAAKNIRKGAI